MSSPPAVIVRLELEAAPTVTLDFLGDDEAARMDDWLAGHPAYRELIEWALFLAERERAA